MSIKNFFKKGLTFAFAVTAVMSYVACSDDSSADVEEEEFGYTPSSSSISTRTDIGYKDTIVLNKKLDLNIELNKCTNPKDSCSQDNSEIYVDSTAINIPLYIGELTRGSRIKVKASTGNIDSDKIRIKNEHGEYLKALTAVARNSSHQDSSFGNYMIPSLGTKPDSTYRDSNQFVVFNPNHYYLELEGNFTDESTARLYVQIDTSYYNYTGENDSISMKMNDTLRGIILMGDEALDSVTILFSASEGYSLNLTTTGTNISSSKLFEGDSLLEKSPSDIDTMLIPIDTVQWTLKIAPETFTSVWSGPFAFFNTITRSRALGKGEYFAHPDSIEFPGEAYLSTRPKDIPDSAIYRYNLRQEQFVWMGDYKKGDSLFITHWIANYDDNDFKSPVTYEILNKDRKVLGSISSTYGGGFSVPADGPYYLHYIRLNSFPKDQVLDSLRYVLQLFTMVQQPGLLKEMKFYDDEMDDVVDQINVSTGDTLRLSRFSFNFTPNGSTQWKEIGSDVNWYVPCESLNYINRNYKIENCETEQLISSDFLVVSDEDEAALKTAELIAESVADPTKRATLKISIIKAAE